MKDLLLDPYLAFYADLRKHDVPYDGKFMSDDAYGHICAVTTATWTPLGYDFNSTNPDYIEVTESQTVMNFTSGNFSIISRVRFDSLATEPVIFNRGNWNSDGYRLRVHSNGYVIVTFSQSGANQEEYSTIGGTVINTDYTLGFSRNGATVTIYQNGADVTAGGVAMTNPTTCSKTAKIGIADDKAGNALGGKIKYILVFSRWLSPAEHLSYHLKLRD